MSVFKHIKHVDPEHFKYPNWEAFTDMLYDCFKLPAKKADRNLVIDHKASMLLSPAVYENGTKRKNENVKYWGGWVSLDVDDSPTPLDEVIKTLNERDVKYVCYSTASCTKEHLKYRILFCLDTYVSRNKIRHFWYAINNMLGGAVDKQTKDFSRIFYVPGQYPNAWNFFYKGGTKELDVNKLLSSTPYVEPEQSPFAGINDELKLAIMQGRKNQMTNTSYDWTSYKNCPFVKPWKINWYKSLTKDWYGGMFSVMLSIATEALKKKYDLTPLELTDLIREIDRDTGCWYKHRNIPEEARRAIEYAYAKL